MCMRVITVIIIVRVLMCDFFYIFFGVQLILPMRDSAKEFQTLIDKSISQNRDGDSAGDLNAEEWSDRDDFDASDDLYSEREVDFAATAVSVILSVSALVRLAIAELDNIEPDPQVKKSAFLCTRIPAHTYTDVSCMQNGTCCDRGAYN